MKLKRVGPVGGESPRPVVPYRPWRRRLIAGALWALVAIAALGGVSGLVRPSDPATASAPATRETVDPAVFGFGETAVRAWLGDSPPSGSLEDLFLAPPEPRVQEVPLGVEQATAVGARQEAHGYWAVTVAVLVRLPEGDALRSETWFFEVGIVHVPPSYRAVAAPARVAQPVAPVELRLPTMERPDNSDPLVLTVQGFLGALLAGGGDVARYTAPGIGIAAVQPTPCDVIEVVGIRTDIGDDKADATAAVECTTGTGTWTFVYQLNLSTRDDRWEIRRVTGAPSLEAAPASTVDRTNRVTTTTSSIASEPGA